MIAIIKNNKKSDIISLEYIRQVFENYGKVDKIMRIKGKNKNSIMWKFFI